MQTVASEYAKKAYLEVKTIPVRSAFFDNWDKQGNQSKCTCGLAAIYLFETLKEQTLEEFWKEDSEKKSGSAVINYFQAKGYNSDYLSGFTAGFDGANFIFSNTEGYEEYKQGYEDGKNIWEEVNYLANPIPNIQTTE